MDILGVGIAEIIFIAFIALLIFGPRRLPGVAAKAGKFVRDFASISQTASQAFMMAWQKEISLEELNAVKEVGQGIREMRETVARTRQEIGNSVKKAMQEAEGSPQKIDPEAVAEEVVETALPAIPADSNEMIREAMEKFQEDMRLRLERARNAMKHSQEETLQEFEESLQELTNQAQKELMAQLEASKTPDEAEAETTPAGDDDDDDEPPAETPPETDPADPDSTAETSPEDRPVSILSPVNE